MTDSTSAYCAVSKELERKSDTDLQLAFEMKPLQAAFALMSSIMGSVSAL